VILAALGVLASGTAWPDLAVAAAIAALSLHAAFDVIGRSRAELRDARTGSVRERPAGGPLGAEGQGD